MPINFKMLQARNDAGLTQKAAAELLGVSREVFNAWENGRLPTPRARMTQLLKVLASAMAEAAANSALVDARVKASTDPRVQAAIAPPKPVANPKPVSKHPCPEHMTKRMQSTHHQTWEGPDQAAYYRAVGKEVGGSDAAVLKEVRQRYFDHTMYLVYELGMEPYAPQKQDDLI